MKNTFITITTFAGCEIKIGHRICPIKKVEKWFLVLNARTMSDENLFVIKP